MREVDYVFNLQTAREALTLEMTVDEARDFLDVGHGMGEAFDSALDRAQGTVFGGEVTERYIVIRIVPTPVSSTESAPPQA